MVGLNGDLEWKAAGGTKSINECLHFAVYHGL